MYRTSNDYSGIVLIVAILLSASTTALSQDVTSTESKAKIARDNQRQADSLSRLAKKPADDTTKVSIYTQLAAHYTAIGDFDSAIINSRKAHDLAVELNNPRWLVSSLLALGGAYGNFGSRDYERALGYYKMGAEIAEKNNLYSLIHGMYYSILNIYFYSGDFPSAMGLTMKGLSLAESHDDQPRVSHYHNLLGFIYLRQGNLVHAEENYRKYLQMSVRNADSIAVADAHNCLAEVVTARNQYTEALDFHFKAWKIYNLFYARGMHYKHDQLAYTAYRISHVYKLAGNYQEASKYSSRCFEFTKKHGTNEYDMVNYLLNAGEIDEHLGNHGRSLVFLHRALDLSKKIKHQENIRDSYALLSNTHKHLGRFDSAYHYQSLYASVKDSIVSEKSIREIQHIHAEYNLQKKDQAIAMQQAQLQWQNLLRNVLIVVFGFSLVILFLLYNRYRLKQKNKFQAELAYQQHELFNTLVTFQDTERQRIAQDIHDSVGSVLSAAKLQLSALDEVKDKFGTSHIDNYNAALALIDQASTELRNISHNIMPAALSRVGLVAALENLIDKISTYSGVHINFNVYGFKERLAEKTEIGIYPVVLELINNVLKHAQASQATVQLVRHPQYINITVEDNGKGFNVKSRKSNGIGLKNVMSRIQVLKGTINIDSSEGQGTSVMIDIPY